MPKKYSSKKNVKYTKRTNRRLMSKTSVHKAKKSQHVVKKKRSRKKNKTSKTKTKIIKGGDTDNDTVICDLENKVDKGLIFNKNGDLTFNNNINIIEENMFANCEQIKKVTIPSFITEIKKNAFSNCKNLEDLIFEDNENLVIHENAFHNSPIESIMIIQEKKKYGIQIKNNYKKEINHYFSNIKEIVDIIFEIFNNKGKLKLNNFLKRTICLYSININNNNVMFDTLNFTLENKNTNITKNYLNKISNNIKEIFNTQSVS